MKHLFTGLVLSSALLVLTGCYGENTPSGTNVQKETKCGSGKCDNAKKVEKKAKCGTGKCGEGK